MKRYKFELLKKMTDLEDAAAWLVVWAVPLGTLVVLLRDPYLDFNQEVFAPVFEAGQFGLFLLLAGFVFLVCEFCGW